LSFISTEKDLLTRLKQENTFVDRVIETYLKKERKKTEVDLQVKVTRVMF
jgi:hypothetical protein